MLSFNTPDGLGQTFIWAKFPYQNW